MWRLVLPLCLGSNDEPSGQLFGLANLETDTDLLVYIEAFNI
jgi:hypothetical protein